MHSLPSWIVPSGSLSRLYLLISGLGCFLSETLLLPHYSSQAQKDVTHCGLSPVRIGIPAVVDAIARPGHHRAHELIRLQIFQAPDIQAARQEAITQADAVCCQLRRHDTSFPAGPPIRAMVAGHVTTADEQDRSHIRIANHAASHVAAQPTKHAPSGREARRRNADAVSRDSDRAIPIIGAVPGGTAVFEQAAGSEGKVRLEPTRRPVKWKLVAHLGFVCCVAPRKRRCRVSLPRGREIAGGRASELLGLDAPPR
ncbi:hypothetical protein EKO27_g10685 [Xylaria grammica]|uniref:Uncharacterized protein n=1 Tax=Xylaria grammica TaxID=363999 RepID=A0A439CQI6_9PEZI|nr:hypothetical protein EKO27_g10685 [Xylaria grammica]